MDEFFSLEKCYIFDKKSSEQPRLKRVASFDEQREPQAKPALLKYFGKTGVNNNPLHHF